MRKKDETIHLRLNESLLRMARAEADKKAGGNLSSYIRQLMLSQSTSTNPELQKELQELRIELNRIGVNVNQIAKSNNKGFYRKEDPKQLLENQEAIITLFQQILDKINSK